MYSPFDSVPLRDVVGKEIELLQRIHRPWGPETYLKQCGLSDHDSGAWIWVSISTTNMADQQKVRNDST